MKQASNMRCKYDSFVQENKLQIAFLLWLEVPNFGDPTVHAQAYCYMYEVEL